MVSDMELSTILDKNERKVAEFLTKIAFTFVSKKQNYNQSR